MRRPAHLLSAVLAAAAALLAWLPVASAEECDLHSAITAKQAGQNVLVTATVVIHSGGQPELQATRIVTREGPLGSVATSYPVTLDECTNPTAPPEYCACLMGSISFTDECVRPGAYLYRLEESEAATSIEVNDTGHECLDELDDEAMPEASDEVRPGCSMAAATPTARPPLFVLLAALLARRSLRRALRHRN